MDLAKLDGVELDYQVRRFGSRSEARRTALAALLLVLMATLGWSAAAPAAPGKSATAITGSFSDTCRDFQSHSSKDISHVEIHYADGRVVKDETVNSPDFSMGGGAGDEIDFAIVKSGTTTQQFPCDSVSPPVALLEIKTPPNCGTASDGTLGCDWSTPTVWRSTESAGFGCSGFESFPCTGTVSFRGTSSTDPENDIVSWSIDFGDGMSASGNWTTNPPAEVSHHYASDGTYTVVLTVTDSAGQSSSDSMAVGIDTDGLD